MNSTDPRIDAYIEKSAEFAKPILNHIRELVHSACPQVEETMKWGFPHFLYKGILCSKASFKQHCAGDPLDVFLSVAVGESCESRQLGSRRL